jgi:hypothetical protein
MLAWFAEGALIVQFPNTCGCCCAKQEQERSSGNKALIIQEDAVRDSKRWSSDVAPIRGIDNAKATL